MNYYREANRRLKKSSLLAAYGVVITLRTGGEEGPARDILLKLVEEMDQVIQSNIALSIVFFQTMPFIPLGLRLGLGDELEACLSPSSLFFFLILIIAHPLVYQSHFCCIKLIFLLRI